MRSSRKSIFGKISHRATVLLATCVAGTMLSSSCNINDARAVLAGVDAAASQLDRGSRSSIGDQLLNELDRIFTVGLN